MYNKFQKYFNEIANISKKIDLNRLDNIVQALTDVKKNQNRVFCIGVGGSAGNCSHLVNDLRKLCNIDAISPVDNTPELTARINDDGWATSLLNSIKVSKIRKGDLLFVLSVGGGNKEKKVSINIVKCIDYCKKNKVSIAGIVGRKDGHAYKNSDLMIHIPVQTKNFLTPISESYQAVIWHAIVSDHRLQDIPTKW